MSFRNILERYQNGTATPEESRFIEEELEKNELINNYLADRLEQTMDGELPHRINTAPPAPDSEEIKKISSSIRFKFIKMTALCCIILILLGILTKTVLLPAYEKQFYDPSATFAKGPEYTTPLDVDVSVFSWLHCPGWYPGGTYAEHTGLGQYNVSLSFYNSFHEQQRYQLPVSRGKVNYPMYSIPFRMVTAGAFFDRGPHNVVYMDDNGNEHYEQQPEDLQYYLDEIAKLPEHAFLSAYVSFTEDLTLEQLVQLEEENPEISFSWAAVRTSADDYFEVLGFPLEYSGVIFSDVPELDENYPALNFEKYNWETSSPEEKAEMYRAFFSTMLDYISHQEEFLNAFGNFNGLSVKTYTDALSYIQKNGMKVYGVQIKGEPQALLKFNEHTLTNSFMLEDTKFSILG